MSPPMLVTFLSLIPFAIPNELIAIPGFSFYPLHHFPHVPSAKKHSYAIYPGQDKCFNDLVETNVNVEAYRVHPGFLSHCGVLSAA